MRLGDSIKEAERCRHTGHPEDRLICSREKKIETLGLHDHTTGSPFAVLTAIVAPAILTNASSVLALGTSNRLARVVDRTRIVAGELAGFEPGSPDYQAWATQLEALQIRAQLLVKALRLFYAGLGLFAASALVSVGGAIGAYYGQRVLFEAGAALAVLTGASAVAGLVFGCVSMVRETQLAVRTLAEEAKIRTSQQDIARSPR
jgi:predicted Kef-type K+ transport protein